MVNNFTYSEDKTPMDLHHECAFSAISFCFSRINSSRLLTLAALRCSRAVTSGPDTTSVMWHRALVSTGNKYHWLMYSPGKWSRVWNINAWHQITVILKPQFLILVGTTDAFKLAHNFCTLWISCLFWNSCNTITRCLWHSKNTVFTWMHRQSLLKYVCCAKNVCTQI